MHQFRTQGLERPRCFDCMLEFVFEGRRIYLYFLFKHSSLIRHVTAFARRYMKYKDEYDNRMVTRVIMVEIPGHIFQLTKFSGNSQPGNWSD